MSMDEIDCSCYCSFVYQSTKENIKLPNMLFLAIKGHMWIKFGFVNWTGNPHGTYLTDGVKDKSLKGSLFYLMIHLLLKSNMLS